MDEQSAPYFVATFVDSKSYSYLLCDEDGQISSFATYGQASNFMKEEFGTKIPNNNFLMLNLEVGFKVHKINPDCLLGNYLCKPFNLVALKYKMVLLHGLALSSRDGSQLRAQGISI